MIRGELMPQYHSLCNGNKDDIALLRSRGTMLEAITWGLSLLLLLRETDFIVLF
jgi:hypothetical protein